MLYCIIAVGIKEQEVEIKGTWHHICFCHRALQALNNDIEANRKM